MGRSLWWLAGAVLAGAAGVGVALWKAPDTVSVPPPEPGAEAPALPGPAPAPPLRAQQPVPPGITADQWAALAAQHADRPAELQRLADYLRFADTLARWQAAGGADRRALAAELDAGLDERLARREVTAGEARRIKAALLDDLLPDAPSRAAALKAWEGAQPGPSPDARAAAAREADFQQRQAAIVAAWRAQPAHLRDPQALERALDALRSSAFPAPAR